MPAQYIVTYGHGKELPALHMFENALTAAKALDAYGEPSVTIINADGLDICDDVDCTSCNRDGLTPEEREALSDAGLA